MIVEKIKSDIICIIQDEEVPDVQEYVLMELRNYFNDENIVKRIYKEIMEELWKK